MTMGKGRIEPYKVYRGYIIAQGITMPSYDVYEYEIFENFEQFERHSPVHTSESETEAEQWVDRQEKPGSIVEIGLPLPRGLGNLPIKKEMDELDGLLEKASGILMRWRLRMRSVDRAEYPTVFESIDKAERAMTVISDALTRISGTLGFSIFRGGKS